MSILAQMAIVFATCLAGEALSAILPFPFPPSIAAMLLLLAALWTGILKVEHIRHKSDFLLSNMSFFFIPAGVRVIEHLSLVSAIWWRFIVVVVVSTVAVFLASALAAGLAMRFERRRR